MQIIKLFKVGCIVRFLWQISNLLHISLGFCFDKYELSTGLSSFQTRQILHLYWICITFVLKANASLSYLSSGQISYLLFNQMQTNMLNVVFDSYLYQICLLSNLCFRPVFLLGALSWRKREPCNDRAIWSHLNVMIGSLGIN